LFQIPARVQAGVLVLSLCAPSTRDALASWGRHQPLQLFRVTGSSVPYYPERWVHSQSEFIVPLGQELRTLPSTLQGKETMACSLPANNRICHW